MSENLAALRYTLLSALIGFTAFCASYAYVVWDRRNASLDRARRGARLLVGNLRRAGTVAAIIGVALTLSAFAVREVVHPAGKLNGDDLFAVRARQDAQIQSLYDGEFVRAGEEIARFSSPKIEAEIQELNWHCQLLQAEQETLRLDQLELDAELVRAHEAAVHDRRQLRESLRNLLPAHAEVVRDGLQARLKRLEEIAEVQVELDWHRGEIDQSITRRDFNQRQLGRLKSLSESRVSSDFQVENWSRESSVYEVEVSKMQLRVADLTAQQERLRENLVESDAQTQEQSAALTSALDETRAQLDDVLQLEQRLGEQLAADAQRAERGRQMQIAKLDFEIKETQARRDGLENLLVVRAPTAGRIVYKSRSPQAVYEEGPMLIVGPSEGHRLRVRLPKSQLDALRRTDSLAVQFDYTHQVRNVAAQYRSFEEIPGEPAFVLADLDCILPHETAWMMAEGEEVAASLAWSPPVRTLGPFQAGMALVSLGGLCWIASLRTTGNLVQPYVRWLLPANLASSIAAVSTDALGDAPRDCDAPESATVGPPTPATTGSPRAADAAAHSYVASPADVVADGSAASLTLADQLHLHVEYGQAGAMLVQLGERFCTAVEQGQVTPDLLAAVEWALDRHQQRAVRLLAQSLQADQRALQQAQRWAASGWAASGSAASASSANEHTATDEGARQRLARVFRILGAESQTSDAHNVPWVGQ